MEGYDQSEAKQEAFEYDKTIQFNNFKKYKKKHRITNNNDILQTQDKLLE